MEHPDDLDIALSSCSAADPAERVAVESEGIPKQSAVFGEAGNGTVLGIPELVRLTGSEPAAVRVGVF